MAGQKLGNNNFWNTSAHIFAFALVASNLIKFLTQIHSIQKQGSRQREPANNSKKHSQVVLIFRTGYHSVYPVIVSNIDESDAGCQAPACEMKEQAQTIAGIGHHNKLFNFDHKKAENVDQREEECHNEVQK